MTGWKVPRAMAISLLLAGLSGCAHEATRKAALPANQGDASWHIAEQPGTHHYSLALGEVSSGATPEQRVTPVYPAARLGTCPAVVEITAQLVVDTAGHVIDVRPANAVSTAPDLKPYLEATRAAAMGWLFSPLQINHWSADANGESHVVDSRTLPFSLDYAFRFTCHAGKARVSAGNAVASGKAR